MNDDVEVEDAVKFKELCPDSFTQIRKRIENEITLNAEKGLMEPTVKTRNPFKMYEQYKKRAKTKKKPVDPEEVRKPRADFATGATLPEHYTFPKHLEGVPIEEIDEFYKNQYVSLFKISKREKI
jgi:hypothetical protein